MSWTPGVAESVDIPELSDLVSRSAFELQKGVYTEGQISAAMGPVFGIDEQLIKDGTYYVVRNAGRIIGCGGWSFRRSLFGGSQERSEPDPELNPKTDPARIRAFFTDPDYARQGVGSSIIRKCEKALAQMGFTYIEISATLPGEPLYAHFGYRSVEVYEIPLVGAPPMAVVKMRKAISACRVQNKTSHPSLKT